VIPETKCKLAIEKRRKAENLPDALKCSTQQNKKINAKGV